MSKECNGGLQDTGRLLSLYALTSLLILLNLKGLSMSTLSIIVFVALGQSFSTF